MLTRFRRITTSGRFIPEIDGLRFVAIASVVLYHLQGFLHSRAQAPLYPGVDHGYRGVDLFFVISGFILALPFAAHHLKGAPRVSLRSYFLRRLTRLEPPYLASLLLLLCAFDLGSADGSLWRHFLASAVYAHSLIYGQQSTINPVAWTLEIEVQFYCLLPLIASLFALRGKRTRRAIVAAVMVCAEAAQLHYWGDSWRCTMSLLYAIQFFLAGLLLADIYILDWDERPAGSWYWDLVSLVCWPPIFLLEDRTLWLVFPFAILLLYVAAFRGVAFRWLFRNPLVTTIGGMCYTIYLLHYRLIPLFVIEGNRAAPVAMALRYLAALSVVSCVFFLAIERPCMQKEWPRRLFRAVRSRLNDRSNSYN